MIPSHNTLSQSHILFFPCHFVSPSTHTAHTCALLPDTVLQLLVGSVLNILIPYSTLCFPFLFAPPPPRLLTPMSFRYHTHWYTVPQLVVVVVVVAVVVVVVIGGGLNMALEDAKELSSIVAAGMDPR